MKMSLYRITSILTSWINPLLIVLGWAASAYAIPQHAAALYGEPKYAAGFAAFDYVNPNAPKGGILREAAFSAFDTLNPFVINGMAAPGIGLTHDTLMKQSADEPFTLYGLIADTIDISDDRRTVTFHINPQARFSDDSPITAEDVVFSFHTLRDQGVPMYRAYYRDVVSTETPTPDTVVFHLGDTANRELPLILGELPVLSKTWWENRDFTKTSFDIPVSSGPYLISKITPNRTMIYQRNPNYWGSNLNVNRGFYNFDEIRYDVYRDSTVAVEAFKAGLIDIRLENEAKKWHTLSESEFVKDGRIIARSFKHGMPSGMQGFVFNLRRPLFQDIRVRRALAMAFDFDWTNRNLFYGSYTRTESYFENSFLKAPPLPDKNELELLAPFKDNLPATTLTEAYTAPGKGQPVRRNLSEAFSLLQQAGWKVDQRGILRDKKRRPFRFEILLDSSGGAVWERVVLPYINRLSRLGITATVRTVDTIQYKNRLDKYDYDMMVMVWGQSFSPGNEQRYYWGSEAAKTEGSWNFSGIQNPAVDAIIEKIVSATTKAEHLTAVHALDRILLHSHLVVPHWHIPENRYLYWDKFGIPDVTPIKGTDVTTWWQKDLTK